MKVNESRCSRVLLVTLDPGAELLVELMKTLDSADTQAGWVRGSGIVEDIELETSGASETEASVSRLFPGRAELLSLEGVISRGTAPELSVSLARETERGQDVVGGRLRGARAVSVHVLLTALDEREGGSAPERVTYGDASTPTPAATLERTPKAPDVALPDGPPLPPRRPPSTALDNLDEVYPEPGDAVSHFHFGECTVLESDGERIRFRQGEDGRVREVALSVLKIELTDTNSETGKRHFRLLRKN